jgi:EAL domain-containing protein (putative c-di-GMP-specific phosphodiesterase class I)/CheY-like chemotaxis protein
VSTTQPAQPAGDEAIVRAGFTRWMPLVRRLAVEIANRAHLESRDPGAAAPHVGELIACGWVALTELEEAPATHLEALDEHIAARVRGAMHDHLRCDVPARRRAWRAKWVRDQTFAALVRQLGRVPSDEDIAAALGITLDDQRMMVRYIARHALAAPAPEPAKEATGVAQLENSAVRRVPSALGPTVAAVSEELAPSSSPRADSAPLPRVLVVDDDERIRRAFRRILSTSGYEVELASDGTDALTLLRARDFDVVVSDIGMPKLDGLALLRAIRESHLDVPLVVVTGAPSMNNAIDALRYGAVGYLRKPVERDGLLSEVARAVKLHAVARVRRHAQTVLGLGSGELADPAALEVRFDKALAQLFMVYQPIVSWSMQAVYGYEALVRSGEPTLPHPGALFDTAERLDRIHQLGRTIRASASGCLANNADTVLFVNLHTRDLTDESLFDPEGPLSPFASRIVLEITERAQLEQVPDVRSRILRLRALGFRIAVDDLGAGYSGLTSFATLEPEVVKLDMSLVRDVDKSPKKRKLIAAMVTVCRDLDTLVVAEGVETAAERDTLVELGCDLFQGYFFGRPDRRLLGVTFG